MLALARLADGVHAADMAYRLSSWAFDCPDAVALWDDGGELLAWAALQAPFWALDYALHPAAPPELLATVLDWADGQAARHSLLDNPLPRQVFKRRRPDKGAQVLPDAGQDPLDGGVQPPAAGAVCPANRWRAACRDELEVVPQELLVVGEGGLQHEGRGLAGRPRRGLALRTLGPARPATDIDPSGLLDESLRHDLRWWPEVGTNLDKRHLGPRECFFSLEYYVERSLHLRTGQWWNSPERLDHIIGVGERLITALRPHSAIEW